MRTSIDSLIMDGNGLGRWRCYLISTVMAAVVLISFMVFYTDNPSGFLRRVDIYKLNMLQRVDKKHKVRLTTKMINTPKSNRSLGTWNTSDNNTSDNKHVLLIWTPFFSDKVWSFRRGKDPFKNGFCSYDNCKVTYDKSRHVIADIVLFHCRDRIGVWPAGRPRDQLYGVLCMESPMYSKLEQYGDRLNITATYRRDSDVFTPYHQFVPRRNVTEYERNVNPNDARGVPTNPLGDRNMDVVWSVGHCITSSKREKYAKELSKHIKVDIFGSCGPNTCPRNTSVSPPDDTQCENKFGRQYKFYLSFENSYCKDYVTEKFFKAYWMELIPIVFGRTDYKQYYPPHSFIDIRDYNSPKELAGYLRYLSKNETAFNEYFEWKKTYVTSRAWMFEFMYCGLCRIMNNKNYRKSYPNPQAWWTNNICDNNVMTNMQKQW